ncbi:MAG TPA: hypothetical protein VMT22_15765, partial [Terriglobales bacterium]|nr:hypothetical protein [Terriglobales bacterium]
RKRNTLPGIFPENGKMFFGLPGSMTETLALRLDRCSNENPFYSFTRSSSLCLGAKNPALRARHVATVMKIVMACIVLGVSSSSQSDIAVRPQPGCITRTLSSVQLPNITSLGM